MPRFDGSGPRGLGSQTGGGFGPCSRGFNRCFGRCYNRRFSDQVILSKEEQKRILEGELKALEEDKKAIEERLKELE